MAGYMTSAVVSAHLDNLASTYPTLCTRSGPGDWAAGWQGGKSGYVKIGAITADSPANRSAVLLSGGVHARELAPPDALISFLEKLLAAYTAQTAITYPYWTDPVDGIIYDTFTIPWPWVKNTVESLDLYVVPLVNDDGRDWVLTPLPAGTPDAVQDLHKSWRKNRRPAPAGVTNLYGIGVDINRNFDILWNYPKYYDMSIPDLGLQSSINPVDETYVGDVTSGSAESEPEAKNLANLMRTKSISYFLDVHQFGRDVLFSWGLDTDQTTDSTQSFTNAAKNGQRDGSQHATYQEYIPSTTYTAVQAVAQHICDQILTMCAGADPTAQARSTYTAMESARFYATSGACDDYCFSRWFAPMSGGAAISPVMAFTIEVGGKMVDSNSDDGGFSPDYVKQYPKLEREIHVAVWTFLSTAAGTAYQAPSPPPTSTSSTPVASGSGCLLLIALMIIGMIVALVVT
jgi:Zinc carboxypeptidase